MSIDDALHGTTRLFIDTAPLIYLIERHPVYFPVVQEVARRIDGGALAACSSVITLTEVLTLPLRLGRADIAAQYRQILMGSRRLELAPITPAIAEVAAEIRARYNLRTPDAIQVATAQVYQCEALLTNDDSLKRVVELNIVLISDLAN
ncbi:MAG: type II toxin-antitoxin system VapC family toxin [Fimbriimonadales bacterium]|nr:MAG: PIN domain nuclease [Fimbriimonadales bacterium]